MNIYEQISHTTRATVLIVSFFILFFLFLGIGFDYLYGAGLQFPVFTLVALIGATVSSYSAYRHGDSFVLTSSHARELDLNDPLQKQWQNVVEEMTIASGIPLPKTFLVDDPDPNAFATGRDPEHASLVVTRGLLETLNRDELQAVASHEMSHIKNFDIRLMMLVAVLVGAIALVSDWAARGLFRSRRRNNSREKAGGATLVLLVVWLVTVVLAPILSQILAMFVSRKREFLADATGAELTRNPLALASALEKIEARVEPTRAIHQGSAHLCICDPKGRALGFKEGLVANLFATHPPIQKRIEALTHMAYA